VTKAASSKKKRVKLSIQATSLHFNGHTSLWLSQCLIQTSHHESPKSQVNPHSSQIFCPALWSQGQNSTSFHFPFKEKKNPPGPFILSFVEEREISFWISFRPLMLESLVAFVPSLCEKRESFFLPLMQNHLIDSCRMVMQASRAIFGDGVE
jgi:hypothetical protein